MKQYLPLLVKVNDKKILIVGGGRAALLKAKGLHRFTSQIIILAPYILDELMQYPFQFIQQEYAEEIVDGFFMVYACTDNSELNKQIGLECERKNILCSVCSNTDMSSFATPAVYKNNNITISIGTNGNYPIQAIFIRDQIQQLIESNVLKIENNIE